MKTVFFYIFIFRVGILYCQSSIDYCQFTPDRRQVLSKMGEFFMALL